MFFLEYNKINYIRDYYKSIAFNIIKIKVDSLSENFYISFNEIIKELYSIFDDFDKFIKCDIELYNSIFAIDIKRKKTFNEFYTRFSAIIALLSYNEIYKISILKRLIILRLRL